MGSSFGNVPQLHRLHPNGMKLSELVELDILISKIIFKKFKNDAVMVSDHQFYGYSQPKPHF